MAQLTIQIPFSNEVIRNNVVTKTLGVSYDQVQPSKSAKARSGRPNWRLSQMQKLCKDTLAAKRVRSPWSE